VTLQLKEGSHNSELACIFFSGDGDNDSVNRGHGNRLGFRITPKGNNTSVEQRDEHFWKGW
jgi:hypothetical protein